MNPMLDRTRWTGAAALALRLALAASFLSAVADRFGGWGAPGTPGVAWGAFEPFLAYTRTLLWFIPASLIPFAGWMATVSEFALGVGLIVGIGLPWVALASGLLLVNFAVFMTLANGAEGPFSYSVWTAAAGAFLLATLPGKEAAISK